MKTFLNTNASLRIYQPFNKYKQGMTNPLDVKPITTAKLKQDLQNYLQLLGNNLSIECKQVIQGLSLWVNAIQHPQEVLKQHHLTGQHYGVIITPL